MRFFGLVMLLGIVWVGQAWGQTVRVAAAISLKEPMNEIAGDFQKSGGGKVECSFGASGILAAQIAQGAPVDVFVSAGAREMDQLDRQGLIVSESRRVVCGNRLVLIIPASGSFEPASFEELTLPGVSRVAIGEPKTVPAGEYAAEVFEKLKIAEKVKSKLVFAENVRQVLDYVSRGDVTAGVVYATDAAAAGAAVKVAAVADESWHSPIVYPAAIVKASGDASAAGKFLDYLNSAAGRARLAGHGFLVAGATTAPAATP